MRRTASVEVAMKWKPASPAGVEKLRHSKVGSWAAHPLRGPVRPGAGQGSAAGDGRQGAGPSHDAGVGSAPPPSVAGQRTNKENQLRYAQSPGRKIRLHCS